MRADRVVEMPNGWEVQSESGKVLGHYPTEAEARHRLAQIEMFKHMRKDVVQDYTATRSAPIVKADNAAAIRRMG